MRWLDTSIIFEAAENALANGKRNQPGMFVRRIRDWKQQQLFPIDKDTCDRAHRRLKDVRGHSSVEGYANVMSRIHEKMREHAARSEDD